MHTIPFRMLAIACAVTFFKLFMTVIKLDVNDNQNCLQYILKKAMILQGI